MDLPEGYRVAMGLRVDLGGAVSRERVEWHQGVMSVRLVMFSIRGSQFFLLRHRTPSSSSFGRRT